MSIQKKYNFVYFFSLIIVLLFFNSKLSAQKSDQEVDIILPKNHFLMDEWLTATIIFKNFGNNPMRIVRHLEPEYGFLKFNIEDEFGNKIGYTPWTLSLVGLTQHGKPIVIPPRESYSAIIDLTYMMQGGKRVTACFKPGTYRIQVIYRVSDIAAKDTPYTPIELKSKWTSYRVTEPRGNDAKAYAMLLKDHKESPWHVSTEHKNTYDRLLDSYPNSVYAQYALFCQALSIEVVAGRRNRESTNKYQQVLENYPDFPLKYMLKEQLMHSYLEIGEIDKAQQIMDDIKSSATDDFSKFKAERELRPALEKFRSVKEN